MSGPLELSNVPRQEFKQGSAVTDDEDSLKIYSSSKLLKEDETGPKRRPQRQGADTQMIDTALNGGKEGLLETDSDVDINGRGRDDNSSDEGLVAPKKVSIKDMSSL